MKESHVRHLFNESGDRVRVCVGLGRAVAGQPRIALVMACYLVWTIACCMGPVVVLGAEGADGGAAGSGLLLPAWMGPLACMAAASVVIAVWFKKTRKVASTPSWMVALASLMTLAAALHLVWVLDTGLPTAARWAFYALSSVVMGAGYALFRVEIDRVFGWIGTQQTLSQCMASTVIVAVVLTVLTLVGNAVGASETPLLVVALVLPFVSVALLRAVVSGYPRVRYFEHGRDVPLPFPAKFVATSFVQGAAGVLFAGAFALGAAGSAAGVEGVAGIAGMVGVDVDALTSAGILLLAVGQMVAVGLLFATLVFLRLDFNRLVYKVSFPFVAAGFVLLALLPDIAAVGGVVLVAAFCFLDLVLWSLGACLMKNMGLPATWIASCPGAALFCGMVAGGCVTLAFLNGVASSDAALLASLVACFVLAAALLLSSGSNLKYGWGTVRPGESSLATGDLAGIVKFVATERGITQRESEVMLLLAQGKSRRAVCEELSVSPDTVKTHARGIYRKLAVHSQQELIDLLAREREDLAADESERPFEG